MSSGLYTHISRAVGSVLTAAIYNSDHQNHINNATPSKIGGYSDTVSEMQLVTDPGGVGTEDLAGGLSGELERLRFVIKRIIGKTHWYETPDSDLSQSGVVPDGSITNAKLANMVASRIKGQAVGATTGAPIDLTPAQIDAIIDTVAGVRTEQIAGLITSNSTGDATNDITVGVGSARNDADTGTMVLGATITKRLDALWTVGTNQGGLDTGAPANNTYHVFLIKRPDTGVVDVLFSLSLTAPTMPANYTMKRLIMSIVRTGGAIKAYSQLGNEVLWKDPIVDLDLDAGGAGGATLRLLTVPLGLKVTALITAGLYVDNLGGGSPCGGWIYSPDTNGVVVQDVEVASLTTPVNISGIAPGTWNMNDLQIRTNTAGQVRSQLSTAGTPDRLGIITKGFIHPRV